MYSEAMRELLDQNYGLNKSSLSPAIQNKLIYSCTSKEVLDKASEHELNVDDLLLICTKDEYKQICQFLNSDLNIFSTEQVNESQNTNSVRYAVSDSGDMRSLVFQVFLRLQS